MNRKNKPHVQYPDVPSDVRPILHCSDLLVPKPDGNMEYSSDSEHSDMIVIAGNDASKPKEDSQPVPLTQTEIGDLT